MRDRTFDFIEGGFGINTMYGVSAIGTRMCFYTLSRETRDVVEPAAIQNAQYWSIDTIPIEWWNLDALSPEGEQRLREAVAHVKALCAQVEMCTFSHSNYG